MKNKAQKSRIKPEKMAKIEIINFLKYIYKCIHNAVNLINLLNFPVYS